MSTIATTVGNTDRSSQEESGSRGFPVTLASLATFLICLYGFVGPTRPRPDPDTWWHLRTGQLILETGLLPSTDSFSWTATGRAWVPHEWLSQVAFAKALDVFGPASLLVLNGLAIGFALLILLFTVRRLDADPWTIAVSLGIAIAFSTITWTVRPHVFSVLLMSTFLYLLVCYQGGHLMRHIWWIVPLTVLWANLHGVFVAGLVLLWIFAGFQLRRGAGKELAVVAVVATAAGTLNPNGVGAFGYPLHVARVSVDILEWEPPGLRDAYGAGFILCVIGVLSLFAWSKQRPNDALFCSGLIFALMGMAAVKNIWIAGLVLAALLASGLASGGLPRPEMAQRIERIVVITLAGVATMAALLYTTSNLTATDSELLGEAGFPVAAVRALNELPPGDVINHYNWGGYLIWAAPRYRVSIDGRNDMYGTELLEDVRTLRLLRPGWDEFLTRPNVRYVLWPRDGALSQAMALLDGWELVYGDHQAVLYQRVD